MSEEAQKIVKLLQETREALKEIQNEADSLTLSMALQSLILTPLEIKYLTDNATRCVICNHVLAFHDNDNVCLLPDCGCGYETPESTMKELFESVKTTSSVVHGYILIHYRLNGDITEKFVLDSSEISILDSFLDETRKPLVWFEVNEYQHKKGIVFSESQVLDILQDSKDWFVEPSHFQKALYFIETGHTKTFGLVYPISTFEENKKKQESE